MRYDLRPCRLADGSPVPDLFSAWITLDHPAKLNAYDTPMLKSLVLALARASHARDVVAVVLTGAGERAFCTGGDAVHYAEAYAGRPQEFARYLRLFSDVITALLHCDKPVLNRVNGLRIAGGQEFGLACDVSIASDLAEFGQAGPKHGSAPVMGATDFLPLYVGRRRRRSPAPRPSRGRPTRRCGWGSSPRSCRCSRSMAPTCRTRWS